MNKVAFFAFKGDAMCFTHVLLNALDMKDKGNDVKIILEGEAVKLIKKLTEAGNPLFKQARDSGLIDCVCKSCSSKMDILVYNEHSGIRMCDEMLGHPSMQGYIDQGYQIITL